MDCGTETVIVTLMNNTSFELMPGQQRAQTCVLLTLETLSEPMHPTRREGSGEGAALRRAPTLDKVNGDGSAE